MPKTKFYAVAVGVKRGIYTSWAIAGPLVTGFKGAIFKSFATEGEAKKFLDDNTGIKQTPPAPSEVKNIIVAGESEDASLTGRVSPASASFPHEAHVLPSPSAQCVSATQAEAEVTAPKHVPDTLAGSKRRADSPSELDVAPRPSRFGPRPEPSSNSVKGATTPGTAGDTGLEPSPLSSVEATLQTSLPPEPGTARRTSRFGPRPEDVQVSALAPDNSASTLAASTRVILPSGILRHRRTRWGHVGPSH